MKTCSIEGCGEKHFSKGYCNKHYMRFRRLGSPLAEVKEIAKPIPRPPILCKLCGKEFKPHKETGKKKELQECCSKECADIVKRQKQNCQRCGKEHYKINSYSNLYCSQQCRNIDYTKTCLVCSKVFVASTTTTIICSDDCRKEYARGCSKEAKKIKHEEKYKDKMIVCSECSKEFVPEYGSKKRVFCSNGCFKRNHGRNSKARRRARIMGCNNRETVNLINILKRDGWRCQKCGIKTPLKYRGTIRDDAPEVDHIEPLSTGGSHTSNNMQCLCRKCNSEKGATAWGQMRIC
jgi:endogenous inhibitor of DNA gyrase (YacG/DUF329 family)